MHTAAPESASERPFRRRLVPTARRGYTLLELVLVLAIIVVITGLSFPALEGMYGYYKATSAADSVRGAWTAARSAAIDEGRAYRFAVVLNKGNYRIAPDEPGFWSGGPAFPEGEAGTFIAGTLPAGVSFTHGTDYQEGSAPADTLMDIENVAPGDYVAVVTFLPNGSASNDVQIVLQVNGARAIGVRLRALTGGITTATYEGGR
jgi:prepilin-type N-terminal cleavage/methylation domain-containing protein